MVRLACSGGAQRCSSGTARSAPPRPLSNVIRRPSDLKAHCQSTDTSDMSVSDFLEMKRRQVNRFKAPEADNSKRNNASVLGVDFSLRKTGLAVSNGGLAPRPLKVMKTPYKHVDAAKEIVRVAQSNSCGAMVVGVPLTPVGILKDPDTDSQVGRRCRNFAHTLAMVAKPHNIAIYIVSERYSTMEAEELLIQSKRKKRAAKLDATAAVVILETYFRDQEAAVKITPTFGFSSADE